MTSEPPRPTVARALRALGRGIAWIERLLAWPLIALVLFYRKAISPGLPPACRFYPSCSAYADEALRRYGLVRGGALMTWRLCRCQPLSKGGYDPVPGTPNPSSDPTTDEASASPSRPQDTHRCCV